MFEIHLAFHKMLDLVGWRSLFGSHLWTYGAVFVAMEVSAFLYSLCMYDLRWRMELTCWVEVGGILG